MTHADKRSVSTDALETLGTIIDETQARDAIHLAVEPVQANEKLFPGQDIGLIEGKASSKAEKLLGIVDPFLKTSVLEGEWFWMVIYPRKITSLRHVWSHPDIPDTSMKINVEPLLSELEAALSREEIQIEDGDFSCSAC